MPSPRFIETLRRYINHLPVDATGWLAGVRDSIIGHALALLHNNPSHPWTIAELAREVGLSRSRLTERFRHYLDQSAMAYLAQWRLRLGAEILQTTYDSVAQVAAALATVPKQPSNATSPPHRRHSEINAPDATLFMTKANFRDQDKLHHWP